MKNIRFLTQSYTDIVLLFKDIRTIYENLSFDPEIKFIKIRIFFINKNDNKSYTNYFFYKTRNTLPVDKFWLILKENVVKASRNFPPKEDLTNYNFLLVIDYLEF